MHQRKCKSYLSITVDTVFLLLFTVAGLFAQLATGKVEGVVRDKDTGKPLAGAQVLIEGTRLGNVTNADGYYFILNVPPGRRDITFAFTGYQKTTVASQLVLADQTVTVNGQLSSTVIQLEGITVAGESEIIVPRDETSTKRRLTSEQVSETPVNRLEDAMILEAGVEIGGRGSRDRGLRIRGGRIGEEAMIIDGLMVRNYSANPFKVGQGWVFENDFGSTSDDTSPLEVGTSAVEEVDIITGGFQAEYGNAQSGIVNIVTKEGGSSLAGNVRYTTDQLNPRTSDFGYNQMATSLGGPIPVVPDLYFHLSGEIQGEADRSYTHADEGFRGIDQTFVDRLNDAVRNDPAVAAVRTENPGLEYPYTLEQFRTGHEFYVSHLQQDYPSLYKADNPLHQMSLFSPDNPVRLPYNWGDRTLLSGKFTYSPVKSLKLIASDNWSRNQHSYPAGYSGEGNYFQTGVFYKGDPLWEGRDWGTATQVHVPQAYGRRIKTDNLLSGFDWNIFRSAARSASLQFRFSYFGTVAVNQASLETDWERSTFMSWSAHDIRFEIERYFNKEGPHPERGEKWVDGELGWKQSVPYETPFEQGVYTAYYMNYMYSSEKQKNYKADLDFQVDRHNRAKLGMQFTHFDVFSFGTNYKTTVRNPLDVYKRFPEMWSAYLQNRTDVGDLVVDYGLRYDGYAPVTNWGRTATDPYAENFHPQVQTSFSPRFDVAFPVTEKAQFRFSYGVFTQLPNLQYMTLRSEEGSGAENYGDLGYSRTDAFESGMSYLLTDDMVMDLVAYYRDIDGNLATKEFFRDYWKWKTEERIRDWFTG
ncbi:carboxypeptidase-like regulatory domain-containing protein, partial [bacterium]|nr:carboxypeptidase-like regulatory domain-containing protein [bacterium]